MNRVSFQDPGSAFITPTDLSDLVLALPASADPVVGVVAVAERGVLRVAGTDRGRDGGSGSGREATS
jgi:hypothetical protein